MNQQDDNKRFWERFAFLYTPFMKSNAIIYRYLAEAIEPYLNQDMQVLELACGTGQLTLLLADKTSQWLATDFSPKMIENARRRSCPANVRWQVEDATALSVKNESFDLVVIANALHIMPDPDAALAEIHRVLKPGGLLFAPTFVYDKKPSKFMWVMEKAGFKTFHKWTSSQLAEYVSHHGFRVKAMPVIRTKPADECALTAQKLKFKLQPK